MFMIYIPIDFLLFITNDKIIIVIFSNNVIKWRAAHRELSMSYIKFVVQKQFYDCLNFLNHD